MSDAGKNRVVLPADADILLGRGKPFQNHAGNQRMLGLVDKYRERYQQAERKEKHDIVEEVMGIIGGNGGRFLRRVDYENYWIEVSHAIAYRKVGHAFRSKARKVNSTNTTTSPMTRDRVEAPAANYNSTSSVEDMLLADLRIRRAALHQADFSNMNNLASLAAQSPLERFLLPTLYTNLAAAGLLQAGIMTPENLLCQQNLLAATAALMGGKVAFNTSEPFKTTVTSTKDTLTAAQKEAAVDVPSPPAPTKLFQPAATVA